MLSDEKLTLRIFLFCTTRICSQVLINSTYSSISFYATLLPHQSLEFDLEYIFLDINLEEYFFLMILSSHTRE